MANEVMGSLFGITPEAILAQRDAQAQEQAMRFAKMDQLQKASYGAAYAGNQLGGAVGGLLGAQDPELAKAATLQGIMKSVDTTTPEGMLEAGRKLSAAGLGQYALPLVQQAQVLKEQTAKAGIASNNLSMEQRLRDELSKLPENASEEDVLKVVTKYGSADKVLAALQSSQARKADRESRERMAQQADETKRLLAQQANDTKLFLGQLTASLKASSGQKLSSADIKMVNEAQQSLEAADFNIGEASNFLTQVKSGEMVFGAGENLLGGVRSVLGKSNASDQNKVNLQQWVEKSSADLLRMDVGTKTEGDAQRAKAQVLSGLSKNDPKLVQSSLEQYIKVLTNAKQIQQNKLNVIAEERGKPGLANVPKRGAGTVDNPIVLK